MSGPGWPIFLGAAALIGIRIRVADQCRAVQSIQSNPILCPLGTAGSAARILITYGKFVRFGSVRSGPAISVFQGRVGAIRTTSWPLRHPDRLDQGPRRDQLPFRQAVEPPAIEVDHARWPQRRQGPSQLADQMVEPLARVRPSISSGEGRARKTRLASGVRGQKWIRRHRQREQETIRQQELQAQVGRLLEAATGSSPGSRAQETDQPARRDEHLGDLTITRRPATRAADQRAHGSSTSTGEDGKLPMHSPRHTPGPILISVFQSGRPTPTFFPPPPVFPPRPPPGPGHSDHREGRVKTNPDDAAKRSGGEDGRIESRHPRGGAREAGR